MTDPLIPAPLTAGLDPDGGPAGTSLREAATEKGPKERKLPGKRARVTLEGSEPYEVQIDNRDYLRWDKTAPRQKWGSGRDVPFLMATFLAWAASTRAGLTDLKWADFEAAALEVEELTEDESDLARPTR